MDKGIMAVMMAIVMVSVLSTVVQAFAPAPPPTAQYCCPLEPDVCFFTYEELYSHFTSAHPTEPIDIIWG